MAFLLLNDLNRGGCDNEQLHALFQSCGPFVWNAA